ncbi:MAG: DUF5752 family protein [Planctomycetota bacterium]
MRSTTPAAAGDPFEFRKCLFVPQALGLHASTLDEFLRMLSVVDDASIYWHLHEPYVTRVDVRPSYLGGFALWIAESLGERLLAERLSALDPVVYSGRLPSLRQAMCRTVAEHLLDHDGPGTPSRRVPAGEELAFCTTRIVVLDGLGQAKTLAELRDGIAHCGSMSAFMHTFDTLGHTRADRDDFSQWVRFALDDEELADEMFRIDPYDHSIEGTRALTLAAIDRRLAQTAS